MLIENYLQFKKDLTTHKKITKNIVRKELNFIKVRTEGKILKLSSTDSFRIFNSEYKIWNESGNGFIPIDKIDEIKKEIKKQNKNIGEIDLKKFTIKKVENYPDLKKALPKYQHHFKIKSDDLKRFIKIARQWAKEAETKATILDLKLAKKKLICQIKNKEAKSKVIIPVIHSTLKYIRIFINPVLLDDLIPVDKIITIKKSKANEPILFNNNSVMAIKKSH